MVGDNLGMTTENEIQAARRRAIANIGRGMTENEAIERIRTILAASRKAYASGEHIPSHEEARKAEALERLDRYHEGNAKIGLSARESFQRSKIDMRADMEILHGADYLLAPSERTPSQVDANAEVARAAAEHELDTFIAARMAKGEPYQSAIRLAMREIRSTVELALGARI